MNKPLPFEDEDKFPVQRNEQVLAAQGYGRDPREDAEDDEIDLRELFAVLRRRKGTILLIALLTFIVALVTTLMMKPIYRASATLQVDLATAKVLNYDVEANSSQASNAKDFYQTQFEILQSRALAKRTIESMGLEGILRGDQLAKPFYADTIDGIKGLFSSKPDPDIEGGATENAVVVGSSPLEDRLIASLTVSPVKNSQIVKISYDSDNPELAANIVNAIADNYIEMNLERRVAAASFAKEFLAEQLIDVKSRLEESEANLNNYAKEKGLFKTGDEKSPSLIALRINDLSAALSKAEGVRITAQSKFEETLRAESASKILASPIVQELKKSLIKLQSSYQEKLQIYKPGYPLMVQMKRQINEFNNEIDREVRTIQSSVEGSLRTDFLAAKSAEDELSVELDKQKLLLTAVRDKSIGYNTLLREVETSRSSYEGLLTRMKEVSVAGGVDSNNISVLDPAILPFNKHKPNTKLNLALGMVLGLFLGTVLAFLLEFLDDRIKTTDELERLLGLPLLGMTPSVKGTDPSEHSLLTMQQPSSALAEAFRSLRTNLLFASREGTPKVLSLTSAMPSEGKSSSCLNLATAFAQSGTRVLLIDADLRKPTVHKRLKLDNSQGLSNYLTHQAESDAVIQETMIKGVSAITAGPLSPNPSELLSSERLLELFKLVPDTFDIIIIDSPPVMGLADALILANRASATVLVTAFAQSRRRQIQDAHRRLKQAHANLIGTIFSKVKSGGSYGYNYEYEYYYSYGSDRLTDKTAES